MKRLLFITIAVSGMFVFCNNTKAQDIENAPVNTREFIAWYNQLSDARKDALSAMVRYNLIVECPCCTDVLYHPLGFLKALNLLVAHARQILATYPQDRIFGIGQSPAYIIETAKMLRELEGKSSDTIQLVAFSGNFLKLLEKQGMPAAYVERKKVPTREQIITYRNYLRSVGLAPEQIVDAYKKGAKTVIVDFTATGEGLASFIRLLTNWAKEDGLHKEVRDALYTDILVTKEYAPIPQQLFPHPTIHRVNAKFMEGVADCDVFNDRLVQHYSFKHWLDEDPLIYKPSVNAQLIRFYLLDKLVLHDDFPKKYKTPPARKSRK